MSNTLKEIKSKIQETKSLGDVIDLDLSEINIAKFTPEIAALIEAQKSLEVLILTNCGLTTLENFPKAKFQALDLSNNKLSDDCGIEVLSTFPDLTQIFAGNNNIKQISTVMKLKGLAKLIEVDFEGNPVSQNQNYSKQVFENFTAIQYVDRKDKDGNLLEDDDGEGEFEDDEDDEDQQFDDDEDEDEEDFDEEQEESDQKPKRGKKRK